MANPHNPRVLFRSATFAFLGVVASYFAIDDAIAATQYHYCITGDKANGNIFVTSRTINLGKEWYKTEATQDFCMATGSHSCTAVDFSSQTCGQIPQQTLTYQQINGQQILALFGDAGSGNVTGFGQHTVDLAINGPELLPVSWTPSLGAT